MIPAHMIWLAGADRPEQAQGLAHRREHRACALEVAGVAAAHDGEGALAGALDATAHRAVEERGAARGDQRPGGLCGGGRHGGAVDDEAARRQPRRERADDLEHVVIRRHTEHEDVASRREGVRRGGMDAAELGREFRGARCAAVPDALQQSGAVQVARHVGAHGAESEESCPHGAILTGTPASEGNGRRACDRRGHRDRKRAAILRSPPQGVGVRGLGRTPKGTCRAADQLV
jgi:hypothetical protein